MKSVPLLHVRASRDTCCTGDHVCEGTGHRCCSFALWHGSSQHGCEGGEENEGGGCETHFELFYEGVVV
jgi:hypothetical protein